ncbi:MAG TPA: DMT family transporter [Xanthobacteraceae bacterium]|jgi:drug/metabolite transporter (DMT)-like permease
MATLTAVPRQGMGPKPWLLYALATTMLWGVWGAFTGLPEQRGFPETLVYCVWSLTMIAPAIYALARADWQLDRDARSLAYGMVIGLLGAGGQMMLFYAVKIGPPYLIFPVISLSPIVTILLSYVLLHERTNRVGAAGIVLALIALPLFDFSLEGLSEGKRLGWFLLSLIVMAAWGVQAYFMKAANHHMRAESIFFYMMVTGLMLAPVAWAMTDFSRPINWGAEGPYLAAGIQVLNAIGALTLVYAFRYGQAMVVSPLTNAGAPLITAVISLAAIGTLPSRLKLVAVALACIAALLLALTPEEAKIEAREL